MIVRSVLEPGDIISLGIKGGIEVEFVQWLGNGILAKNKNGVHAFGVDCPFITGIKIIKSEKLV